MTRPQVSDRVDDPKKQEHAAGCPPLRMQSRGGRLPIKAGSRSLAQRFKSQGKKRSKAKQHGRHQLCSLGSLRRQQRRRDFSSAACTGVPSAADSPKCLCSSRSCSACKCTPGQGDARRTSRASRLPGFQYLSVRASSQKVASAHGARNTRSTASRRESGVGNARHALDQKTPGMVPLLRTPDTLDFRQGKPSNRLRRAAPSRQRATDAEIEDACSSTSTSSTTSCAASTSCRTPHRLRSPSALTWRMCGTASVRGRPEWLPCKESDDF